MLLFCSFTVWASVFYIVSFKMISSFSKLTNWCKSFSDKKKRFCVGRLTSLLKSLIIACENLVFKLETLFESSILWSSSSAMQW